jgi:hypothetical protein
MSEPWETLNEQAGPIFEACTVQGATRSDWKRTAYVTLHFNAT